MTEPVLHLGESPHRDKAVRRKVAARSDAECSEVGTGAAEVVGRGPQDTADTELVMLLPVGVGPLDRKVTLEQGERSRKIARDGQAQRSGRRGRVGQHRWKALLQRAVRPHRGVLAVAAHVAELGQDRRKPSSSLSAELVAPVPCLPREALGPLQVSGELGDLGLEVETPGALPKTCQLLPRAEAAPTSPASRKSSTAAIIRASASGPGSVTRAASRVSSAARCRAPPCWCASAHE